MATSLEAIAEKLQQERQNKLESILSISGSQAIAKNNYGITVVEESNVASSLVFKELNKNKYDTTELLKAVDVVVTELKPDIPTANLDLVPKPLYDEKVVENEDLRKQVTDLTATVVDLNVQITDLKGQVQTEINNRLTIEQTNDALVNQLQTLTQTIDEFALQIQVAVQKSVDESILRTSLQAQNTGFKAQIEALINQDPVISERITLWNREGSRVIQGNLLVIPIEQSLLYVEPLYLEAEKNTVETYSEPRALGFSVRCIKIKK
jgi:hypothetical protein